MTDVAQLRDLIETERERFGVPGMAVAIVADGEVVLSDGFGLRDVDAGQPVTSQTLFAIASDTKCFTAATLCTLVDEGLVDLDRPVREYIPWFEMYDPHATALVTPRDLLSHRTGLPRHDFVWYGHVDLTREDIVRRLRYLEPSRPVRQAWQYNNLAFETAGYLTEVLLECTWQDAVRSRLLDPLGMKGTLFSTREAESGDFANPYKEDDGRYVRQAHPRKREGGPAGGLVSSADDMSRWVLARLGRDVDGQRPLSDSALQALHSPSMIGGVGAASFGERLPMGYALGCQVESYRGHRVIRHGGNLVGYSSDVCVAPDAQAGVVVLTNMHGSGARDALALMVLDRLLGLDPAPWGERYHELSTAMRSGMRAATEHRVAQAAGRPPTRPLGEYAGTYEHPAYGVFDITVDGDELASDFHGLHEVLRLSHRDLDVWNVHLLEFELVAPLVFATSPDGEIASMSVPMEPMVAPIMFTRTTAAPPADVLDALVGAYAMGPLTVTIARRGDAMVAQVPGAGLVTLLPAGGASFRASESPSVRLEFELDDSGAVRRLVVQPAGVFEPVPPATSELDR